MPMHVDLRFFDIPAEVELLKKADKRIIAIVPTTIEHKSGTLFGSVIRYAIIFEDKE